MCNESCLLPASGIARILGGNSSQSMDYYILSEGEATARGPFSAGELLRQCGIRRSEALVELPRQSGQQVVVLSGIVRLLRLVRLRGHCASSSSTSGSACPVSSAASRTAVATAGATSGSKTLGTM